MRETQQTPEGIFSQVADGHAFNNQIGLYKTVEQNERFYNDDQWHGVAAPNLLKVQFNFLSRVVKFFISSVTSDDIGMKLASFEELPEEKPTMDMLTAQLDEIMERTKYKAKGREVIRNAAVDGDALMHFYFDTDAPAVRARETPGEIEAEIVENTNVHFGNPQSTDVQRQPYLLFEFRRMIADVKETAKESGGNPDDIQPDEDEENRSNDTHEKDKVTVVRKYWKQRGADGKKSVWAIEVTRTGIVRKAWDTGYTLYPVAFLPWEKVKNQYHGKAALTGYIPAQIFVNKAFAMAMKHIETMAFPKVIYNKNLIKNWTNAVGQAIGASGDPNAAVASSFRAQDMSAQLLSVVNLVMQYAKEMMGASDAALGNVTPDNTSAIIATQKATAMPLELQRQAFYDFVEDSVRIWLDMMAQNYGVRSVRMKVPVEMIAQQMQEEGIDTQSMELEESIQTIPFDFANIAEMHLTLNVEIGAATYWSELMQVQTLDNLMAKNLITDAEVYLQQMPRGYIPGKQALIDALKKQKEMEKQAAVNGATAQVLQNGR